MRYVVVIEKADKNYSAYVPDLPGCVATGATVEAVETEIRAAVRFHIDGLRARRIDRSPGDQHRRIYRRLSRRAAGRRRSTPADGMWTGRPTLKLADV